MVVFRILDIQIHMRTRRVVFRRSRWYRFGKQWYRLV